MVSAENVQGDVDPGFNGTVTIALQDNPTGATLGGTLTVTAVNGVAVFDGLTLNKLGNGYSFRSPARSSARSRPTPSTSSPTRRPARGRSTRCRPTPACASAIDAADSNGDASNTIVLSAATYVLDRQDGRPDRDPEHLELAGQDLDDRRPGGDQHDHRAGKSSWTDRIFEVVGTSQANVTVVFQDLAIEGGNATGGGILGGTAALGGGLLIDGGTVPMTHVAVSNNEAQGARGADGKAGAAGQAGGNGGDGDDARGGGIYLAAGTLTLNDDLISNNIARGGTGGSGGAGGNQFAGKSAASRTGAAGGNGGNGGSAAGGGVYVAGGTSWSPTIPSQPTRPSAATGGKGGMGGDGILGKPGGDGGDGGQAGPADGGAIYLAQGSLTIDLSTLQANSAVGGAGGQGGTGGAGSSLLVSTSTGHHPLQRVDLRCELVGAHPALPWRDGGKGGLGGNGAAGAGGGVYVGGGTLTLFEVTLGKNQAIGGQGGQGGQGGTGGMGSHRQHHWRSGSRDGSPRGLRRDRRRSADSGSGGGLYLAGGTVTFNGRHVQRQRRQGRRRRFRGSRGRRRVRRRPELLRREHQPRHVIPTHGHRDTAPGGEARVSAPAAAASPSSASRAPAPASAASPAAGPAATAATAAMARAGPCMSPAARSPCYNDTVADNSVEGGTGGSGGKGGKGGSLGLGNGARGSVRPGRRLLRRRPLCRRRHRQPLTTAPSR